jgi:hypothetical protein
MTGGGAEKGWAGTSSGGGGRLENILPVLDPRCLGKAQVLGVFSCVSRFYMFQAPGCGLLGTNQPERAPTWNMINFECDDHQDGLHLAGGLL